MTFAERRIAFIVIGDKILLQQDPNDARDCFDWVTQDLGLSSESFQRASRGYITPGRIQFFTGHNVEPALDVGNTIVLDAILQHNNMFGQQTDICIGNGCIRGLKDEQWAPILVWGEGGRWVFA